MLLVAYYLPITAFWIITSLYLLINSRKVQFLRNITPDDRQPQIAIIIAVRNEETELEQALKSVCQLNHKNKRIVVVNDRSTDRTGVILEDVKKYCPELEILTIKELPSGWLGKNHALYRGYLATDEEWMLFTDADVIFNPDALAKAITYARVHQLDHLTVLPEIKSPSLGFSSILDTFKLMLEIRQRPWAVRRPDSNASIGVGAFNLLKRTAYEKAGTHQAIALRPDDDLKLGERIKSAKLRQDVLYGDGEIWLQWYSSVSQFIDGLMKNTFSVSDYNLFKALATAGATLLCFALPLPVLLIASTPLTWSLALVIIIFQLPLFKYKRGMKGQWWYTFMMPAAGAIMAYIIIRSALLTIKQGGIYWRDSFYRLKDLKKSK